MSQVQPVCVQILRPCRAAGLPTSIPFNSDTIVQVKIQPSLAGTSDAIDFAISGNSVLNGEAIIAGGGRLQTSGTVTIRGTRQTEQGESRNLRIVASLKGHQQGLSGGFSVCAHPCAIENGPHHQPYITTCPDTGLLLIGMEVKIVVVSDSGNSTDLDQVTDTEVV